MQQSILACWIYPNQFCNLSEIRHKRAGVWKHRPVPDESPSASLQGANLFVCLFSLCACTRTNAACTHQLDELLVAHLSLLIALDQR